MLPLQKIKSLQTVGESVPVRLVIDQVNLYLKQVLPSIANFRALLMAVQAQFVDAFEDLARSVFVHGLEDAITSRDIWHLKKVLLCLMLPFFWWGFSCIAMMSTPHLGCI